MFIVTDLILVAEISCPHAVETETLPADQQLDPSATLGISAAGSDAR